MPTTSDEGLGARLSPHFGRAPYFTLLDDGTGAATAVPNPRARHDHGRCEVGLSLEDLAVDVVVCGGLGRNALAALRACGIGVLVTEASRVADALEAFRDGALTPLTSEAACHGHGHA